MLVRLLVVLVLGITLAACDGNLTASKPKVNTWLELSNANRLAIHIRNEGDEKVVVESFVVADEHDEVILSSEKYEDWFPLTVPGGGHWEFFEDGVDGSVDYKGEVVVRYDGETFLYIAEMQD